PPARRTTRGSPPTFPIRLCNEAGPPSCLQREAHEPPSHPPESPAYPAGHPVHRRQPAAGGRGPGRHHRPHRFPEVVHPDHAAAQSGNTGEGAGEQDVTVSWHEFPSGLPLLEALNVGNVDFSADVADTVPVFAQAAGARLVYVAQEAPSPTAQAILVHGDSDIRELSDLKGKR